MKMNTARAMVAAAAIGIAGCSTEKPVVQGQPLLAEAAIVSTQATIVRVNHKNRVVTLEVPNKPGDNFFDVQVGDNVKNLAQVHSGNRVTVKYIESVVVDLLQPGAVEPGVTVAVAEGRAKPGQMPAGGVAKQVDVVAVIEGIDKQDEFVRLRGPEGRTKTVKVNNPAILDRLHVGDKVRATFARALAVSVTPSPVR
jgi:hypothetical protein